MLWSVLYLASLSDRDRFMGILSSKSFSATLYQIATHRASRHILIWFIALLLLTLLTRGDEGFWFTLRYELVNVLFYAVLVYFNIYYLIPNYLTKKRFFTYALLLILSAIIITPLQVTVEYFLFTNRPELQRELLVNQHIFFLFSFFIAGSSTIIKIISDWTRQLREQQALEKQTIQTELRFLKTQINPHFLFNTLNNLYALTLKKSDQAPEIVLRLSEMMRYMLYECNEKRVLLSKEINYIKNYLELERLRQGKTVEIHFDIKGDAGEYRIAPLMFIPFLENSFKHGLGNQIEQGYVNIRLSIEQKSVEFLIENSKPETPPQQDHRPSGGIGLVNVHRRLNLLYPDQYNLKIDDTPKYYRVRLYLELD